MPKPTLAQEKILQALREGYKLLHRHGFLAGAWLISEDLGCTPVRIQTFNGLVLRGLIVSAGPTELYADATVMEYKLVG